MNTAAQGAALHRALEVRDLSDGAFLLRLSRGASGRGIPLRWKALTEVS